MDKSAKTAEKIHRVSFSFADVKKYFDSTQVLPIVIGVAVVLITLFLLKLIFRGRKARRDVQILGLCDAGKTLIWSQLLHGRKVDTLTSIKENIDVYQTNKGLLRLVDVPGHERLRMKFFDQYKETTRALIFVIDAMTFQKDLRDVAEFLYNILLDNTISYNSPSMLILAHKQDLPMAKGISLIQSNLEKELNLLRETKDKLISLSAKSEKQAYLGKQGKEFSFSQLNMQIDFAESSAVSEEGIESVKKWLASTA